ncbi:MAG: metal ABC transporter permease [bacterium]
MENINYINLITGIFVGGAAGYLGSIMVLRKMALVGDALSHVALPGIALALLFNINPFIGAFSILFIATIGIWFLEQRTSLSVDALVGVFFTASLAIGILITPEMELLEALFGDISKVTPNEAILSVILSIFIIFVTKYISKNEILGIISKDLAKTEGIKIERNNLIYLLLVSTVVALGIKAVGTLLMGALVIIPAASAKNISSNFKNYSVFSLIFGSLSSALGILLVQKINLPSGPLIILSSCIIFTLSVIFRKR